MLGRKIFSRFGQVLRSSRSRASVQMAARVAVCETLEGRRLLTQFTFDVPQNEGYTAVYLRPAGPDGWVDVFKNVPTGTPVYTFKGDFDAGTNTFLGTGMYIVDAGAIADFLFVDQVPAGRKPTATAGTPSDHGILVKASSVSSGNEGHLKIEAGLTDQYMTVTQSTSTSNTVEVLDITVDPFRTGTSRAGAGVNKLTLRTSDVVPGSPPAPATAYFPTLATFGGGTDVEVRNVAAGIFVTVDTGAAEYNRIWLGTNEAGENGRNHEETKVITGAGRCIVRVAGESGVGNVTEARIDFGPRSQTGHNRLEVRGNGTATLAQLAGANHTIVVEEVHMQAAFADKPAILYVEDRSEIDDLDEIQQAQAYIEQTADDTEVGSWFVNLTCTARIQGESTIGDFTIEGEVEFIGIPPNPPNDPIIKHSTVNNFEIDATSVPASNGKVNVSEYADVTALNSSRIGALDISSEGKFTLQARPQTTPPSPARLLTLGSLFIEKDPTAPEGILDLKDNSMIIDYSFDSPLHDIRQYITEAYDLDASPHWITNNVLHNGINSSIAAARTDVGIGYAEATDIFTFPLPTPPPTFEGQVPE